MTNLSRSPKVLVVLGALAVLLTYGVLALRLDLFPVSFIRATWFREPPPPHTPTGYWARVEPRRPVEGMSDSALTPEEQAQLLSVPYLAGSVPATSISGVTRHDAGAAHSGVNLYVSGHGPEAILMDMDGETLHRWTLPLEEAFPGVTAPREHLFWRRARLLGDGGLLAVYEYIGVVRIDVASRLIWAHRGKNHHDLDVDEQGNVWVLGQQNRISSRAAGRLFIADDLIIRLDADGNLLDELSVYDLFDGSDYASVLDDMGREGDVFHTNTITVLDGSQAHRSPHFAKGNLLISVRNLDAIAIVDPTAGKVVWALDGLWIQQHEPVLLDNGHLLVFDNNVGADRSRVVELDPFTRQVFWEYEGSETSPFYSRIGGSNQRFSNGNTLVVESEYGRAFEVSPAGEIVWEFLSPHRAGDENELVAVLFDLVRLDPAAATFVERGGRGERNADDL